MVFIKAYVFNKTIVNKKTNEVSTICRGIFTRKDLAKRMLRRDVYSTSHVTYKEENGVTILIDKDTITRLQIVSSELYSKSSYEYLSAYVYSEVNDALSSSYLSESEISDKLYSLSEDILSDNESLINYDFISEKVYNELNNK